jgi:hypothetical protein
MPDRVVVDWKIQPRDAIMPSEIKERLVQNISQCISVIISKLIFKLGIYCPVLMEIQTIFLSLQSAL